MVRRLLQKIISQQPNTMVPMHFEEVPYVPRSVTATYFKTTNETFPLPPIILTILHSPIMLAFIRADSPLS